MCFMSKLLDENVSLSDEKITTIQERALKIEKSKLHMTIPQGAINEIEQVIREEIN